jgi:2-polyprenyl-3-methyl-5-hydroxy-6-metoxy-1,4-benzoquinol methylase
MSQFEQQNKVKEFYNKSDYFSEVVTYTELLKSAFQKYRITKVKIIYSPNKEERVLDLGCALGTFCFALAPQCKEIIGLDYSRKAIDIANKLLKNSPYNNIKFICRDAQSTELESASFDVIICADLVEHLYPKVFEKVLDECQRLLKKGGKLVIWTPHRGHVLEILKNHDIILKRDVSHVDYKSMDYLLRNLRKRNFLIQKSYYAGSHIPILRILERLLLPVLPIMRRRIAILAKKSQCASPLVER